MFDIKKIEEYVEKGLVIKQRHSSLPLNLYCYSKTTEVDDAWDDITKVCRGLVIADDGEIVHNPMPKFFNIEQVETIPSGPFFAYEKMDGSMICASLYKGELIVSTKGSFDSEQAQKARQLLEPYKDELYDDITYIFEIIYPENRIVVDYGDDVKLVLLSERDKKTGYTFHPFDIPPIPGVDYVKSYSFSSITEILVEKKRTDWNNKEGFVLFFPDSGERIKVKYDQYFILHKIRTELSEKAILEALKNGNNLYSIYAQENLPDEFIGELKEKVDKCLADYGWLDKFYQRAYIDVMNDMPKEFTSKDFALEVNKLESDVKAALFMLYRDKLKDYDEHIWKVLLLKEKDRRLNND